MLRKIIFFAVVIVIAGQSFGQNKDETSIRALLTAQTKEWNNGNIASFMKTYWKSDSLTFIGKSGITYGWQKTMDNYKKNYPDTTVMGKLKFELLQLKPLSASYYFVIGKWYLTRSIGDISGTFTLLFRKFNGQWLIVADHSS